MRADLFAHPHEEGYSLIEVMVALCVTAILAGMAVAQIGAARPMLQADGAMRGLMGQLNAARETAVAQRRAIELNFIGTNALRLTRQEVPNGATVLREVPLEAGIQFHLITPSIDTPDGFGNGSAIDFGAAARVLFNSDGMLIDGAGIPVNGTVFLANPGTPVTFRAVTVLGTTGRVRGYKWNGISWTRV